MPDRELDKDELEQLTLIEAALGTLYHFFGGPAQIFQGIDDPRMPELTTYPLEMLGFVGNADVSMPLGSTTTNCSKVS